MECLLKRNKSLLTLKNDKGWTSLQIAVAQKSPELVKLLVENGAAVDRNILFWAIHKGWPEVVKCLLKRNKSLLTLKNDKGWTPLRQAIIEGTPELVKLLVENGAAIDKEAWRSALWRGNLEIVGALLDKKPELLNAENECGRTPLEVADHIKNKKLVEFLLARGARNKVRIEVDPIKELKKSLKKFGIKF